MTRLRLILKFIFFLPGTFLHELTHYIAALILGKAEGFSVWPKVEGNSFVFGSVKSRTRLKILSSFIAVAPILWWAVLFIMLRYIFFSGSDEKIAANNIEAIAKKPNFSSYADVIFIWMLLQLLWAGRLSIQDIKNFFSGLLSVSGFALLAIVAGLVYLIKTAG